MTQSDFYDFLKQAHAKYRFVVNTGGEIRQTRTKDCPVTAVYRQLTGEKLDKCSFEEAAVELKLTTSFLNDVAGAADEYQENGDDPADYKLRRKLLKMLGLQEISIEELLWK